jgi:hypothetical protein
MVVRICSRVNLIGMMMPACAAAKIISKIDNAAAETTAVRGDPKLTTVNSDRDNNLRRLRHRPACHLLQTIAVTVLGMTVVAMRGLLETSARAVAITRDIRVPTKVRHVVGHQRHHKDRSVHRSLSGNVDRSVEVGQTRVDEVDRQPDQDVKTSEEDQDRDEVKSLEDHRVMMVEEDRDPMGGSVATMTRRHLTEVGPNEDEARDRMSAAIFQLYHVVQLDERDRRDLGPGAGLPDAGTRGKIETRPQFYYCCITVTS